MNRFFAPNLTPPGRIFRAALGIALVVAGLLISAQGAWLCILLVIAGGFSLFEAARGWCVMRACGIKTKL